MSGVQINYLKIYMGKSCIRIVALVHDGVVPLYEYMIPA